MLKKSLFFKLDQHTFSRKVLSFADIFLHTDLPPRAGFERGALVSEPDVPILCPPELSSRKIVAEFSLLPPSLTLSFTPFLSLSLIICSNEENCNRFTGNLCFLCVTGTWTSHAVCVTYWLPAAMREEQMTYEFETVLKL